MKVKLPLLTLLLLSIIFCLSFGKAIIPIWLCAVIVVVSVIILVYWLLYTIDISKTFAEKKFIELNEKIANSTTAITDTYLESQEKHLEVVQSYFSNLNQLIEKSSNLLNETISTETKNLLGNIESQENNNNKRYEKLLEEFSVLKKTLESDYSQLSSALSCSTEKISELGENVHTAITKESELTRDCLSNTTKRVEENIVAHTNTNKKDSDEAFKVLITSLHKYLETISALLSGKSDDINSSLIKVQSGLSEHVSQSEGNLLENVNKIIVVAVESIQKQIDSLAQETNANHESMKSSAINLAEKSDAIIGQVTQVSDDIVKQVKLFNEDIQKRTETRIASSQTSIESSIEKIEQSSKESYDLLMKSSQTQGETIKEAIDSIELKTNSIEEAIANSTGNLLARVESVNDRVNSTEGKIDGRLIETKNAIKQNIDSIVKEVELSLTERIESSEKRSKESYDLLMKSSQTQGETIKEAIDSIELKTNSIEEAIANSTGNLLARVESVNDRVNSTEGKIDGRLIETKNAIKQNIDSIVKEVELSLTERIESSEKRSKELADFLNESNTEQFDSVQKSIITIQEQGAGVSNLISNNIKESDKATELFLQKIDEQYDSLNKNLESVQIKTQNIEESVSTLVEKDNNNLLISSVKSVVGEIKSLISNTVSDLNNQFLDSQISQETTNNELSKLQTLLRTVLLSLEKSHEEGSRRNGQPNNSNGNPNRTEKISDKETGNTVINQFKSDKLIKSTMRDSSDTIIYEMEYVNDKIVRSKNYDKKGKLNLEQTYYDNGQVHYRIEFTSSGKKTTEFDINGKKK